MAPKDIRVFGNKQYHRHTGAIPLRRAKTMAKKIRATGTALARVDAYKGEWAVWIHDMPEKEQLIIKKKGKYVLVQTSSWKAARDYIVKRLDAGWGFSWKIRRTRAGKPTFNLKFWKMKKILKPRLIMRNRIKNQNMSNLRKLSMREEGDLVFIIEFSGRVKIRKNPFSNDTYSGEFSGSITISASEDKINGQWQVVDEHQIMYHVGTELGTARDEVKSVAAAKSAVVEIWEDYSSRAEWYNGQYAKYSISDELSYINSEAALIEFLNPETFADFETIWWEYGHDEYSWEG